MRSLETWVHVRFKLEILERMRLPTCCRNITRLHSLIVTPKNDDILQLMAHGQVDLHHIGGPRQHLSALRRPV
jgi:hypothetical protein